MAVKEHASNVRNAGLKSYVGCTTIGDLENRTWSVGQENIIHVCSDEGWRGVVVMMEA